MRKLPHEETCLRINFFPGLSKEQIFKKVVKVWQDNPRRSLGNSLMGLLPKKVMHVLPRNLLSIDPEKESGNLSREEQKRIIDMLSGLSVRIRAPRGFQEAQVTSGGVSTDEIDPKSMESKLVKSLFFAGEVLDVAGDCGGFNLQFAFSSGYAAGLGASAD